MREIKFRAWDEENGMHVVQNLYFDKEGNLAMPYHTEEMGVHIMQYTGLKDKNGKEIYEGDIIKYDENEGMNHWVAGSVAQILSLPGRFTARMKPFDKYNGSNQNMLNDDFQDCVTVIGNIYENPDLLDNANPQA